MFPSALRSACRHEQEENFQQKIILATGNIIFVKFAIAYLVFCPSLPVSGFGFSFMSKLHESSLSLLSESFGT